MKNDAPKLLRGQTNVPTFELELTKGPDGRLRSFRISISIAAIVMAFLGFVSPRSGDCWSALVKWVVGLK
jgi:hypothetical protein